MHLTPDGSHLGALDSRPGANVRFRPIADIPRYTASMSDRAAYQTIALVLLSGALATSGALCVVRIEAAGGEGFLS